MPMPFDQDELTRQLIAQLTQPGQAPDPQAAQAMDPFAMAAQHTRQSVMPFGGRREGAITQGLEAAGPALARDVEDRLVNFPFDRNQAHIGGQAIGGLLQTPERAFQASEADRLGYGYDPGPIMQAAMLAMTGGFAGVPARAGEMVAGAGPVRRTTLPMDEASRMARAAELGFDTGTPLYHGTSNEFSELRGHPRSGSIYLTDKPEIAEIYANIRNKEGNAKYASATGRETTADPNILPVYAKRDNSLVVSDKGPDGGNGWLTDNLATALGVERPSGARAYSDLINEARKRGHDMIEMRDMTDLGGPQTQYMALNPSAVRSKFAAFDPANKDSGYLLGSGATDKRGAALIAGAEGATQPTGIRAYHRSPNDFDKFDLSYTGTTTDPGLLGTAHYFSTDPNVASAGPHRYEASVGLKNPIELQFPEWGARPDPQAMDPFAMAAQRQRQAVMPFGGRKEGDISTEERMANVLRMPNEMARGITNAISPPQYAPGQPMSDWHPADERAAINAATQTALGTMAPGGFVGAPAEAGEMVAGAGPVRRTALPMDEASRMARAAEQNYSDVPFYRGDKQPGEYPSGAHFSKEQGYAAGFGDPREFRLNMTKAFSDNNPVDAASYSKLISSIAANGDAKFASQLVNSIAPGKTPEWFAEFAKHNPDMVIEESGALLRHAIEKNTSAPEKIFKGAGYDAIEGARDVRKLSGEGIRLKGAAFDPDRIRERDILSSLLGAGAMPFGAGYLSQDGSTSGRKYSP